MAIYVDNLKIIAETILDKTGCNLVKIDDIYRKGAMKNLRHMTYIINFLCDGQEYEIKAICSGVQHKGKNTLYNKHFSVLWEEIKKLNNDGSFTILDRNNYDDRDMISRINFSVRFLETKLVKYFKRAAKQENEIKAA